MRGACVPARALIGRALIGTPDAASCCALRACASMNESSTTDGLSCALAPRVCLAEWQRGPADLEPLLRAFQGDPSLEVRATCALALGVARARTPQIQRTLAAALGDEHVPAAVREAAWSALGTLSPLPADVQGAFQAYAAAR